MSLRPRYSLLTLLVFTALVAGGVKWWHGPHRVVMNDPPTAEEQAILDTFKERHDVLENKGFTFRYEVERLREWQGTRVLSLKMIPLKPLKLYHFDEPAAQQARILSADLPTSWPDEVRHEFLSYGTEDLVCLLNRGQVFQNSVGLDYNPVIVLTTQKNVYYLQGYWGGNVVAQPGRIDWFRDPDLRVKIQTELDFIPDPK